ncbi:hypothetical protein [Pseudoalteromonas lipolytica]|uniref:hypothetical protein n=1 Tax=Pseudoalteromonas lipolytica TaxID=570156 RepID=UPI000825344F|nr:hypothetical protein [Pseudoalteromonas lipolytica]
MSLIVLSACGDAKQSDTVRVSPEQRNKHSPSDLVVGSNTFYFNSCHSVTGVFNDKGEITSRIILKIPPRFLSTCSSSTENPRQLEFDGTYLIVKLCRVAFGAGGCGVEKYRSKNFEHWQEYIGITWRNGEQYEAWRQLGSSSAKADEIIHVKH